VIFPTKMTSQAKPRHSFRILFIVSALIAAVVAATEKENPWSNAASTDPVLRLTASNYQSTVFHSGKNGMVKFYQSWCGHSIRLKPIWDQLAKEAHPSIFIAHVDCGASKENDICRDNFITTYPALRYYVNGTEYDYKGPLALEALREFIALTLVLTCNPILDATTCSDRAKTYATKWNQKDVTKIIGEIERLGNMMKNSESSTTAELRSWMRERRDILKIIHGAKVATVIAIQGGKERDGNSDEL